MTSPSKQPPPDHKHWKTVRKGGRTVRVAVTVKRDDKNPPKPKGS